MGDNDVFTFPKCNAWDMSALLSMAIRTNIQPGGETWNDFMASVHNLTVTILREARRLAGLVPYKTIPYPSPGDLMPYIIAMKTQYTMEGDVCKVYVGRCERRFGVFAMHDLVIGNVVSVLPVDAIYIKRHGGLFISADNETIDPTTVILRNTRYDDIFIASSLTYFCPERCGHIIHHEAGNDNVTVFDLFGGVMNIVQLTRDVKQGEELILPIHSS
tara:strand:- start:1252 stop:1902 length:651 start_codon:yes stop_codon:yes gene_type:complete